MECVEDFLVCDFSFWVLFEEILELLPDFPFVSWEDESVVVEVFESEEVDSSFELLDLGLWQGLGGAIVSR
ncbi:hypothetical protein GOV07_04525 [Candidatus Woesearchaeota archaeon]|nr:hypothetical protein [Candidatus Woesearchaeota archaeon]